MELPPNISIASGPVIIEDEKVLLDREQKDWGVTPWMFPGGKFKDSDTTFENTCIREAKEEVGIDVEIIKPLRTLLAPRVNGKGQAVLIHYLAKRTGEITLGHDIVEYGWHDIHHLPENCAPNVIEIIADYIKEQTV
jgi:ADP-ribose pyrophosphatase YjhB (NUDIX family)